VRGNAPQVKQYLRETIKLWQSEIKTPVTCQEWTVSSEICQVLVHIADSHQELEREIDQFFANHPLGQLYQIQIDPSSSKTRLMPRFTSNAYLVYSHKLRKHEAECFTPRGDEFVATGDPERLSKLAEHFKSYFKATQIATRAMLLKPGGASLSFCFQNMCERLLEYDRKNGTSSYATLVDRCGNSRRILSEQVVVRFKSSRQAAEGSRISLSGYDFIVVHKNSPISVTLRRVDCQLPLGEVLQLLKNNEELASARHSQWDATDELVIAHENHTEPGLQPESDCYQWSLCANLPCSHIQACDVWSQLGQASGDRTVIVLVDCGIALDHQDLTAVQTKLFPADWANSAATHNSDHGTKMLGIIAAAKNTIKTVGLCHDTCLKLPLPVSLVRSEDAVESRIEALLFTAQLAAAHSDHMFIVNCSWRCDPNPDMEDAIKQLTDQSNVMVVAAAGNIAENSTIRTRLDFPAHYPKVISVSATDKADKISPTSKYSKKDTTICAPGTDICTTLGNNNWGPINGTSAAAAHVTGVLGLLHAICPQATKDQLLNALCYPKSSTTHTSPQLRGSDSLFRLKQLVAT